MKTREETALVILQGLLANPTLLVTLGKMEDNEKITKLLNGVEDLTDDFRKRFTP